MLYGNSGQEITMSNETKAKTLQRAKPRIKWYRSPVDRESLNEFARKSDLKGFLQASGHLALLGLTGTFAWLAVGRLAWPWVALIIFGHGTFYAFLLNGLHELVHETVFRTKRLNQVFLWIYSFLCGFNSTWFWASHTEHHKYTLHPPDDLEVTLPMPLSLKGFLVHSFVDPIGFAQTLWFHIRFSCGYFTGVWDIALFPASDPAKRRPVIWRSRSLLIWHGLLMGIAIYLDLWLLPVLITFGPYYGRWLMYLCNNTQHAGLVDNVTDYRLCCRTITLNPFVQFLYWHMNYHTEHHMYASIPCYNLGKLHRTIKHDLPYCPKGLFATWTQIIRILKQKKLEPDYQYIAELPTP